MKKIILLMVMVFSVATNAERLKDITTIEGVRAMPLIGYGLVVGLPGTGDGNVKHTQSSLRKMLTTMGVKINIKDQVKSKNVASVMVSGFIPPFSRVGKKIDVTVTSIGDAKSIKDGTLLMTTLKGADGETYALSQGQVMVSGLSANGSDNSFISKNRSASGIISSGAVIERPLLVDLGVDGSLRLILNDPDFTTAENISTVINNSFGEGMSHAENSMSVNVKSTKDPKQIASFISILENIIVSPAEESAKIIVNSHTGTVVVSKNVIIKEAMITHGSLVVEIKDEEQQGIKEGEVAQDEQRKGRAFKFSSGISINSLVKSINKLGIGPSDLIAILQSLKNIGALKAELIII